MFKPAPKRPLKTVFYLSDLSFNVTAGIVQQIKQRAVQTDEHMNNILKGATNHEGVLQTSCNRVYTN